LPPGLTKHKLKQFLELATLKILGTKFYVKIIRILI
jgi:hypothetical protein